MILFPATKPLRRPVMNNLAEMILITWHSRIKPLRSRVNRVSLFRSLSRFFFEYRWLMQLISCSWLAAVLTYQAVHRVFFEIHRRSMQGHHYCDLFWQLDHQGYLFRVVNKWWMLAAMISFWLLDSRISGGSYMTFDQTVKMFKGDLPR